MSLNIDEGSIFSIYRDLLLEQAPQTVDVNIFKEFEIKLVRAKYRLFDQYPFFGLTLQKLKMVIVSPEDEKKLGIDTMAVDNNRNIYINVNFVMNVLSDAEVMGVLAHEVMHIATLTFPRQRGRNMKIWNIATDYIMNRDLLEQGFSLPSLGCLPKQVNNQWIVEIPDFSKVTTKAVAQGKVSAPKMLKIDVTDMTAEQLYDELVKAQAKIDFDQLVDMLGELDKHLTDGEAKEVEGMAAPNGDPVYTKNSGEGKSESQKHNENKALVQDAAQQAQEIAKKRGTDAGMPRSFDKKLLKPKTNWKQLLKSFIVGATVVKTDWSRPSRRHNNSEFFHPKKYTEKNELQAVVAIDTSGSISEAVLRTFLGAIADIISAYRTYKIKMLVLLWHANVYNHYEVDTTKKSVAKNIEELKALQAVGGGTNISSIKKFLDKYQPGKNIKGGLLVFTDGFVEENPMLPNAPKKMFFITDDGTDEILKKFGPTYFVDVPHQ